MSLSIYKKHYLAQDRFGILVLIALACLCLAGCQDVPKPNNPAPEVPEETADEPGPGPEGGSTQDGKGVYGKTHSTDGGYSGYTDILDKDGEVIGFKHFGYPKPEPGEELTIWHAVPWGGYLEFEADGTTMILGPDFEVIAKLPPVAEGTKPQDGVERRWLPLPHKGGFWIYLDNSGKVVETEFTEPGNADAPQPPYSSGLLWEQ